MPPQPRRKLTPAYAKRATPKQTFIETSEISFIEIETKVEKKLEKVDRNENLSDSEIDLPELSDDDDVFDQPVNEKPLPPKPVPLPPVETLAVPTPFAPPPPLPSSPAPRIELSLSSAESDRENLLLSIRNMGGFKGAKLKSPSKRPRKKSKNHESAKSVESEDFMTSLTRRLSVRRTAIEPNVSYTPPRLIGQV